MHPERPPGAAVGVIPLALLLKIISILFLYLVEYAAISEMFLLRRRPTAEGFIDRDQL